jgi:uncharacterized protein
VDELMQSLSTSPDVPPLVRTVVLQPTPFCNINCRYCYLPTRNDTSVMPLTTIIAAFEKIFASGWASPQMTVIWHAGEPLVLPVSYYEQAFQAIEAIRPESLQLRHSIQTNGMLINAEWCDLIKKWHIGLGVSVDGPRYLHDANRITRSGAGTFDRTTAGIRLLRKEKIPFHVISVLSEAAMDSPEELLDFYLSEGIEDVCFNVEESEGDHISTLLAGNNPRERFHRFLDRFWILSRQSSKIHFIREIDGMITRIFRPESAPFRNEQVEPMGMLNIDCHGNVSSFSPELLGYKNKAYNDFIIGNVLSDSLEAMRQRPAMQAMTRDIAAGVEMCRKECDYFSVCAGGAPVNKLSENGTFASSKTTFCSLVYMAPTDLILSALDRLEQDVDRTAPMSAATPISMDVFHGAPLAACTDTKSYQSDMPEVALHQIQRGSR